MSERLFPLRNFFDYPLNPLRPAQQMAIDPNNKEDLMGKGELLNDFDKALAIDPNYKVALDNKQAALSKMRNASLTTLTRTISAVKSLLKKDSTGRKF
jgi:hypothetical protein